MSFDLVAVLSALGGLELVKWAVSAWRNRKTDGRIKESEADAVELHTITETQKFLQTQLKEKEERFAEQTKLVRSLNAEVLELNKVLAAKDIELMAKRCDDQGCPFRQPPNAYTPPRVGESREAWHERRRGPYND